MERGCRAFLAEVQEIARQVDAAIIEEMVAVLAQVRQRSGSPFHIGSG